MTVLRPSLPPVSWTTTRMVSLLPGAAASPAANAVRPRNVGTLAPKATSPDVFRNSRRVADMTGPQEEVHHKGTKDTKKSTSSSKGKEPNIKTGKWPKVP